LKDFSESVREKKGEGDDDDVDHANIKIQLKFLKTKENNFKKRK
jgi:hypothetical protein